MDRTILISLLIPCRVGTRVLWLLLLLLPTAVEHLLEELELGGCWEDEKEQRADETLEQHIGVVSHCILRLPYWCSYYVAVVK